jgi:hypothetical protein
LRITGFLHPRISSARPAGAQAGAGEHLDERKIPDRGLSGAASHGRSEWRLERFSRARARGLVPGHLLGPDEQIPFGNSVS